MTAIRPRLLLISYHFGDDGSTGGFRWASTLRHLSACGWDADVVTLERNDRRDAPPPGPGTIELHPIPNPTAPTRIRESLLSIGRALQSVVTRRGRGDDRVGTGPVDPDELFVWHAGYQRTLREQILHGLDYAERAASEWIWARAATRLSRSLARRNAYRAVVVSSPPHLTQIVGTRLARSCDLPYVADYRDPWTFGLGPHAAWVTALERWLGSRAEAISLRTAHTVIHNTERACQAVGAAFPIGGNHVAIRNGYDARAEVDRPDPECFRVLYSGHLYPFMDVRPVFAALARLRERHALDASGLRVDFIGTGTTFNDVALADLAAAYGLEDVFCARERVAKSEIGAIQQAASLLVAFDWLFPIAVVSKFYEYARMRGTPLLIGNREGALDDAARQIGFRVHDPGDGAAIEQAVENAYQRWQRGEFDDPNDREGRFARVHQSEAIRILLESLPEARPRGAVDSGPAPEAAVPMPRSR